MQKAGKPLAAKNQKQTRPMPRQALARCSVKPDYANAFEPDEQRL